MSKKCSTLRRLCSTLAAVVKKSPKVAAVCGSVGLTRRIRPSVKWTLYHETVTLENVTVSWYSSESGSLPRNRTSCHRFVVESPLFHPNPTKLGPSILRVRSECATSYVKYSAYTLLHRLFAPCGADLDPSHRFGSESS